MKENPRDHLVDGYNRMMERVKAALEEVGEKAPTLEQALARARDKAVELKELSREEAGQISDYVRRDIEEAGRHLAESGTELRSWLSFDMELIEDRLLDMLFSVADRTTLELMQFQERMAQSAVYRTGEVTGPGVLECTACGERLHFSRTGRIPPCPRCAGTEFRRPLPQGR